MAKAEFYVQLEPEFHNRYGGMPLRVRGLKARRIGTRYPRDPMPGVVIVKLTVDIPDKALLPLMPDVEITVPIEHLQIVVASSPIAVADDPE